MAASNVMYNMSDKHEPMLSNIVKNNTYFTILCWFVICWSSSISWWTFLFPCSKSPVPVGVSDAPQKCEEGQANHREEVWVDMSNGSFVSPSHSFFWIRTSLRVVASPVHPIDASSASRPCAQAHRVTAAGSTLGQWRPWSRCFSACRQWSIRWPRTLPVLINRPYPYGSTES